jgi:hypothetical protein
VRGRINVPFDARTPRQNYILYGRRVHILDKIPMALTIPMTLVQAYVQRAHVLNMLSFDFQPTSVFICSNCFVQVGNPWASGLLPSVHVRPTGLDFAQLVKASTDV